MTVFREAHEKPQASIYFSAVVAGVLAALSISGATALEFGINPALAIMLFVTFLHLLASCDRPSRVSDFVPSCC
ncbi:hypothetical protein [Pseudaminobacter sp. NGMCC 1.201702]|uniref:hypothetical protein n=1 Tax=Pseudaminobacter sp. NGMCC 1.201702 TaxID=3391825 RepID=UPI0039F077E2